MLCLRAHYLRTARQSGPWLVRLRQGAARFGEKGMMSTIMTSSCLTRSYRRMYCETAQGDPCGGTPIRFRSKEFCGSWAWPSRGELRLRRRVVRVGPFECRPSRHRFARLVAPMLIVQCAGGSCEHQPHVRSVLPRRPQDGASGARPPHRCWQAHPRHGSGVVGRDDPEGPLPGLASRVCATVSK